MLSLHLTAVVDGEHPASLHIGGMGDLGRGRNSHTRWLIDLPIGLGDELRIVLKGVKEATLPSENIAADSDEYLAEQALFEAKLASDPPRLVTLERKRPGTTLELELGDCTPIVASFSGGREFISLSVSWNCWRRERCRVSLSSYSVAEGLARHGSKDWLTGQVELDREVVVRIGEA